MTESNLVKTKEEKKAKKAKNFNKQFPFDERNGVANRYISYNYFPNNNMNFNYFGYNRGIYTNRELANSYTYKRGGGGGGYLDRDYTNSSSYKRSGVGNSGMYGFKDSMYNLNYDRGFMRKGFIRVLAKYKNKIFLKGKNESKSKRGGIQSKGQLLNYDMYSGYDSFNVDHSFKSNKNVDAYKDLKSMNCLRTMYPKISLHLKKNRKYIQKILKKNYTIRIYLVRHSEAVHNREVKNNPNNPRDQVYIMDIMKDCTLSAEGFSMCNTLKNNSKYFNEIINLYNASLTSDKKNADVVKKYIRGNTDTEMTSMIDTEVIGNIKNRTTNTASVTGNQGVYERNKNFVAICSPLRRCIQTMHSFLNIKKNVVVYEAVRETAGSFFCDERSNFSDIIKLCNEYFDDYEILCYGEKDLLDHTKLRETRLQVEYRCLQFLKLIHSLAINYFSNIEKKIEEKELKEKINKTVPFPNKSTEFHSLSDEQIKVNSEQKKKYTEFLENVSANDTSGNKVDASHTVYQLNCVNDTKKQKETDPHVLVNQNIIEEDEKVYNVVLVSHSSFIAHLLAFLDYFELDERVLNNCEIKKISIPLNNSFVFYNSVTNLQVSKPLQLSNFPFSLKQKDKLLKKSLRDKYIYTISQHSDIEQLICTQPCTVVIYRHDLVSKDPNNQGILEKIKKFIEKNNKRVMEGEANANDTNEKGDNNKEKDSKRQIIYSNGIYKKYVLKEKHLGRKLLITDGTDYLTHVKNGVWEIKNRGLFLRQTVVLIVLPNIDITIPKIITEKGKNEQEQKGEEKKKEKEQGGDKKEEAKGDSENGEEAEKGKNSTKTAEKSHHFEIVKTVINNYDSIEDLMRSKKFWKVLKDNIKNVDLYMFHEFLLEKYHKIIKNETDICYLDLVECIKNKNFMEKYQNVGDGYFKKLKQKIDRNMFVDFEKECKYINENLLDKLFYEYVATNNTATIVSSVETKTNTNEANSAHLVNEKKKTTNLGNEKEKEKEKENDVQPYVKRKFIYIPKKSLIKNEKQQLEKQEKNFLASCIKLLKSLPSYIQNLDVEVSFQDHLFYVHCLHTYIKSKNKTEGLVIAKLLCFLDLLKSCDANTSGTLYQKLLKVHDQIKRNTEAGQNLENFDTSSKKERGTTVLCEEQVKVTSNSSYNGEGVHKYKTIQSLLGKKRNVAEDLNHLRYNLLTVCGGAEKVFILNIIN